jgi:hypothetical protein
MTSELFFYPGIWTPTNTNPYYNYYPGITGYDLNIPERDMKLSKIEITRHTNISLVTTLQYNQQHVIVQLAKKNRFQPTEQK